LKNFHSSAAAAAGFFPKKSAVAAVQPLGLHLQLLIVWHDKIIGNS
jgi:hypothetical protein